MLFAKGSQPNTDSRPEHWEESLREICSAWTLKNHNDIILTWECGEDSSFDTRDLWCNELASSPLKKNLDSVLVKSRHKAHTFRLDF